MKQNMNQMICMLVVLLVALIPVAGVVGMMVLSSAAQDMEAPSMLMRFAAEHAVGLRSAVAALLMAAEAGVSILILHKVGEKRFVRCKRRAVDNEKSNRRLLVRRE